MKKRILSLLIAFVMILPTITGCGKTSVKSKNNNSDVKTVEENLSNTEEQNLSEEVVYITDENGVQVPVVTDKSDNTDNKDSAKGDKIPSSSTTNKGNSSNSSTGKETNNNDNVVPNTSKDTNTVPPTTSNNNISHPVYTDPKTDIKVGGVIFDKKPALTEEYILPFYTEVNFEKNDTGIYENKYLRADFSNATKGYFEINYKDPYATSLEVIIDMKNPINEVAYDSVHYKYSFADYDVKKPFNVRFPVDEADFYIVICSDINGYNSDKMVIDLGVITVDGTVSYLDMLPTQEDIKLVQVSSGVWQNKYLTINTNTQSSGYIEVMYTDPNAFDIRVKLKSTKKGQTNESCFWLQTHFENSPITIKAPLVYGNGQYTLTVNSYMKGITGAFYTEKASLDINATNVNEQKAFTLSAGEVIFNSNMQFIKKANEIAATCSNDFEKVSKIYDWLTNYLNYGSKEYTALGSYKCDIEKIYNNGSGVCYDFAVVLAAMLRSQGIPCKTVFGYYSHINDTGHVWNEVYVPSSGSITSDKMSITGNKWCRLDPTYSWNHTGKEAISFINDSSNYIWRYYY